LAIRGATGHCPYGPVLKADSAPERIGQAG
ncbi:MAG: hypothetical protein JWR86_1048, partial [Enterovirga sp.]|nr:hypothetical protein [Enterovirga sp.]